MASLLWSNKPKDHAANSLRQALRELQISLLGCGRPPLLLTGGGRLALLGDAVWVDVHDPAETKWKAPDEGAIGPLLLCQNLQGLDPAFDGHLDKLWKNMVFQQAFVPAADERQGEPASGAGTSAAFEANLPLRVEQKQPQGWQIAVLPFRSLGAPLEGDVSLGMAEEISAALARFRMPRLIATGSFWDGSGPAADALERCRTFNLDYVIAGTIQAAGERVRVTVTLLDVAMSFEVIWASRFEGSTRDLFTLQDTIASRTVAQVDPELMQRHQFRGEAARTANAAAHQLVLTAIQGIYRPDKTRFLAAKPLLEQATALDENYSEAYAWLAYWHIMAIGQGWSDDPDQAAAAAGSVAERAVLLDPLDARAVTIAGHVKAYMMHDLETALVLHQRAIFLNPNLPIAHTLNSWAHIYNGDHTTALSEATIGIELSPSDPHVFFAEHAAMTALMFLGELDRADALASSVLERKPGHASALKGRLCILGHLNRLDEASQCLTKLGAIEPTPTVSRIVARPPLRTQDLDFYAEGLRRAGVKVA